MRVRKSNISSQVGYAVGMRKLFSEWRLVTPSFSNFGGPNLLHSLKLAQNVIVERHPLSVAWRAMLVSAGARLGQGRGADVRRRC